MIHALVATLAYGETRRGMLTSRCPVRAHEQLTPEEKLFGAVPCARCAAPIPPKHALDSLAERDDERTRAAWGGK
jgi:hypothetical protein